MSMMTSCPACGSDMCSRCECVREPLEARIAAALDYAHSYGGIDGAHHKMWVIDQMVRALNGCPVEKLTAIDIKGETYEYEAQVPNDQYRAWVTAHKAGKDGPETYDWDTGIAP